MKVSIMITSYNCQDSIDAAIESVATQDMPFLWELLIGDDGSSDQTVQHIKNWIERYPENIRLYVMDRSGEQSKNGTRAAKNRANLLEHATGEYLIFLDGDDQFLGTEKIKKQVEILERKENFCCAAVAHNILANDFSAGKKYLLTEDSFPEGIVDSRYYWKNLYFHTNTILFRKKCKELMLNNKYRNYLNDNFITYIILQYGNLYYLKSTWAQYNLTGNGLWTGKNRTYGCFRNMILYDLERDINDEMKYESFIRHLYDFRYIFSHYTKEDREPIKQLIRGLVDDSFYYTLLMYKQDEQLDLKKRLAKKFLKLRVEVVFNLRRMLNILKK